MVSAIASRVGFSAGNSSAAVVPISNTYCPCPLGNLSFISITIRNKPSSELSVIVIHAAGWLFRVRITGSDGVPSVLLAESSIFCSSAAGSGDFPSASFAPNGHPLAYYFRGTDGEGVGG